MALPMEHRPRGCHVEGRKMRGCYLGPGVTNGLRIGTSGAVGFIFEVHSFTVVDAENVGSGPTFDFFNAARTLRWLLNARMSAAMRDGCRSKAVGEACEEGRRSFCRNRCKGCSCSIQGGRFRNCLIGAEVENGRACLV